MSERAEQIKNRRRKTIPLLLPGADPEWQGLFVCAMGASDLIGFQEAKPKDENDTRAMFIWTVSIIPLGIVDGEGHHIFDASALSWLVNEEPELLYSVAQQVREFNFVTQARVDEEKKSSAETPSAA